jgi:flagellar motor switch protein FliM
MGKETLSQEELACLLPGDGTAPYQTSEEAPGQWSEAGPDEHATAPIPISTDEEQRILRLRALSEHFAYNLSGALSDLFRAATHVNVGDIDNLTFGEFVLCLDDPTCLVTLHTADERASFVLHIEFSILFPMIERMLGGDLSTATIQRRPLTEIERRLAVRIVELFLDQWKAVCKRVDSLDLETVTVDSSPCRAVALACKETVMHIPFEMSLGNARGTVSLVIPRSIADNCEPSDGDGQRYQTPSHRGQSGAPVRVAVVLAETRLPAADIRDLQVGDVIDTEKATDDALEVTLDGEPQFKGKPGILDGHKAVRIEEPSVRETQ